MKQIARFLIFGALVSAAAGCADTTPKSIAASNEVFGTTSGGARGVAGEDDRWASITLDQRQQQEVQIIFREMVGEPVAPLRPATCGIRFEDVPRAIINAAPKVEMAVLRGGMLPAEVRVDYVDSLGRGSVAVVKLRGLGPLASVTYDVAGTDVAHARAALTIAIQQRLDALDAACDSERAETIVRDEIQSAQGVVGQVEFVPDRYRYTVLMLDEQEVDIVIRREPPPKMVSWTVSAGLFGDDRRGDALGRALDAALRAWGAVPEPE